MAYIALFGAGRLFETANSLSNFLGKETQTVAQRLREWNPDELLNASVDDVIEYLVDLGLVDCPQLLRDDIYQLEPTEIDQQHRDFGETRTRRVVRFEFALPFVGQRDVFTLQAETFSPVPPQILQLRDGEIRLAIDNPPKDSTAIKAAVDAQVNEIERNLAWSRQQIELHNRTSWIRCRAWWHADARTCCRRGTFRLILDFPFAGALMPIVTPYR